MKNILFSNVKDFRYERKFYVDGLAGGEIEVALRHHPEAFGRIYHPRIVNNIYFDSVNMQHYFDNLGGVDRRIKVRVRWYGDTFGRVEAPTLELKVKHNMHVGKLLYPLKPFTLDGGFTINIMRNIFKQSTLNDALKAHLMELGFSLLNSYSRDYFLSADRRFRITVDTDMEAYRLSPHNNSFLHKTKDRINTILELKYNMPDDDRASVVTEHLPFRITRSSKYVDGIAKVSNLA